MFLVAWARDVSASGLVYDGRRSRLVPGTCLITLSVSFLLPQRPMPTTILALLSRRFEEVMDRAGKP